MDNQNNPPFPPPPSNPFMQNPMMGNQMELPNATAILVLGIISIATCWCYGIIGLACGIVALVLSGKATRLYTENPQAYTEKSFKNMKAGRICAIIGTALSALYMIYVVIVIVFWGAALTSMPWQNMR